MRRSDRDVSTGSSISQQPPWSANRSRVFGIRHVSRGRRFRRHRSTSGSRVDRQIILLMLPRVSDGIFRNRFPAPRNISPACTCIRGMDIRGPGGLLLEASLGHFSETCAYGYPLTWLIKRVEISRALVHLAGSRRKICGEETRAGIFSYSPRKLEKVNNLSEVYREII